MPTIPAYTFNGFTRPQLHLDLSGNIVLDPVAAQFAATYGIKALYLGVPAGTPYPPVPASLTTPTDANGFVNSVAEGAVAGTAVGITALATNTTGEPVIYSLTADSSNGGFAINPTTGVVTVTNPAKIDFESNPGHTYSITVEANDGILTSSQSFAIGVSNVAPTTPVDSNAAANSVAEGAAVGTAVGITASSTDVNGPGVTWTLSTDSSGGGFAIDAGGVITVRDSSKVDYESAAGHVYTVTAQASDGTLTRSQTFNISVSDVPVSTPRDSNAAVNSVAEGAAAGTAVGVTASAVDPNGPASTYTLIGDTSGGGFAINSSTGIVTVADASRIDFETAVGHTYTVTALATNGAFTSSQAFTIAVTDVAPSTPTDANTVAADTVSEGAVNGTAVGITVSSTDINGPPPTYSLTDDAGGRFAINSSTGIVTVANGAAIDFETAAGHAYSITAQASDGTLTSSHSFTIGVSDVAPSAPTDSDSAADTIVEGAGAGTLVGVTAASTDVNGPAVIYSFADIGGGVLGSAGGRFQIDSATGEVRVSAFGASNIDYESAAGHAYSVTVQASDGTLTSALQTFNIAVTNVVPSAPVDSDALNPNGVTEGAASGTYTGLTAASADTNGGTVTYSLADSAGGRFTIDSGTGAVSIDNAGLIDFESSGGSYNITVAASDGTNATSQVFAIAVANTAPSIPTDSDAGTADVVTEGVASGVYIGLTPASTDINGPAVTWTLTDDAGGRFAIDSASGAVSTGPNANLIDFETSGGTSAINGSYSITAQASDGAGGTRSQTFAIAVADAPPASWSDDDGGANTVLEGAADGTQVGVIAHAVDPNGGTVTYSLAVNPNNAFAIDASSGIITVADSTKIDFESTVGHQYTLTVQGTDASGHFTTNDFVVDVTDRAPSAPTDTDTTPVGGLTNGVIAEGAAQLSTVGITAHSLDINGPAVTYSLSNDAGGLFTIDATSGVVSVTAAGAVGIDYEGTVAAGHTYAITVEASDGTLSASQNFTIGVTNAAPSQPTDSNGAAGGSIQVNAADNTPVGITLASTDAGGSAVTYSITDPSGPFAVDPNTGVVTLKTGHPALTPSINYTITAVASDGTTQSAPQTFDIFVSNNALNVDLDGDNSHGVIGNGYAAAFTEQGLAVPITDTDDVITNTGSPGVINATSATIVLTNAQAGDSLLVNGTLPGSISDATTIGSGKITITLSGTATYADYQAALHQIQFSNTSDVPNTTPRTINVTVTDSTGSSPVAVSTITVTSVNDAPELIGTTAAVSYTENAALPTALFAAGTVTDPDAPADFAGGSYTVAITGNAATGDQIVLLGSSGFSAVGTSIVFGSTTIGTIHAGSGLGTSSVTIDLNSSATPAVVSALAHAFGFQNSSDNPSTLSRTVSFTFNDGNNSHTDLASTALNSNVVTQTVQVIAVNDAPTAANDTAGPQDEDSGAPWTILGSSLTVNDFTGPSGLNETGQTLTVTGASNAVGGSVTIVNGNVVFTPTPDFNGTASFDYTVQDNGQTNGVNDFKTATGHVTFNVREVNDAPTAANDTLFDIAEDSGARTISFAALTGNDSAGPADEAGQTLAVATVLNAVGGTVQILNGNVIFTPTADFNGAASFDYTVQDNGTTNGGADPRNSAAAGHVTFNVTAVNDAPVTVADTLTSVAEDSTTRTILFTDLTGNDSPGTANEAAQTLTVIDVTNAVGGTVAIVNGHVEFTPTANFNGTASFDYVVQDNGLTNGASDPKTSVGHASFDVTEINDAPAAAEDTLSAIATSATLTARIITFAALTGNDSPGPANEAAQTLTVSAVANPLNGTVVINNGHVEFTPDANFVGTASFDYTVTDDGSTPQSTTGHVTFEVAAIALDLDANDSAAAGNNYAVLVTNLATPIAIADVDTSIIDSTPINTATITISGGFVSGEDTLAFVPNVGTMGDIIAGASTAGVLTLTSAGGATAAEWQAALRAVTYNTAATPTSTADRTVTVVVGDGVVISNIAITTVHFDANDAPAAGDDTLSAVTEDSGLRTIQFAELTANDSRGPANESGQALTVLAVDNSTVVGGTVAIVGGHIEFTPTANFNGTASFDYTVRDNGTTLGNPDPKTDIGHVSFTVTAVNDAPTAAADSLTPVAEDSGIATIAFSALTTNDNPGPTDEAGQTLTVTAVSNAVGGTVAIVNGHVEFTPSANFNGAASFDYTVQDNGTTNGASDPKTAVGHASFTVTEVNDVPVAAADTVTAVAEDSGIDIIQFTELTAHDSAGPANESAQTLTVTAVSNAVGGSVAIVNGHVEFTPAANFNGTASFDYTVTDNGTSAGVGAPKAALGHATIAVAPVNDAPVLDLDSTDAPGTSNFTADYTVSATPVAIAPATVSITDVDDSHVTSATVTLTNAQTNDVLAISGALPGGISAVITPGAGTITVSLSGAATLAQYQAALHQIVFSNGSASPDTTALDRIVTVVVDDGHGAHHAGSTATTTIHLTQDTPPVANAKTASATEAGGLNNSGGSNGAGNVITDAVANSDAENPVSALVVSAFAHGANPGTLGSSLAGDFGTLTLNADGSYSYAVNNANTTVQGLRQGTDTLTDTFNYTIRDTAGLTTSSTLTITIQGANDNPVAVNETSTAIEAGTSAGVNPGGNVLTNDTDVDSGDSKIVQGVAAGTQFGQLSGNVGGGGVAGSFGTLTISADGTYSYVVDNANASVQALRTSAQTLTDTFSYTVQDAANATSTAQVTVMIQGQNDAPVAGADTATVTEAGGTNNGTAGTNISNFNVLTGVGTGSVADGDPDSAANGETQTVQGVETGTHLGDVVTSGVGSPLAGSFGTLTLNSNGSYSYTVDNSNTTVNALNSGSHVNEVFTYTMHDAAGATSTTTLNIQVNGANDAPVGVADSAVVFQGRATTPSVNLLANDTDIDTAAANLTAVKDTNPAHGSVTVNANGSFTYTGNAGYLGADSFTYHVADNGSPNLSSASVTVTLDVQPLVWHIDNTAPAAGEDGSAAHPWHSIAAFNAANAAAGANSLPDIIYLHNGTGTYTEADGFNLKNGQTLLGQGVDLTYQTSASAPGGAHIVTLLDADNSQVPTIVVTAGDGIDLAQNNTVQGLHIGNASGVGISDGGGTVGTLNISGVDINTTGQAIDIDQGGTLNVSLSSVTSSGGAQGIQLGGALTGSFAVTSGTLSGHTGSEFDVTGGAGTISYGGSIGNGSGLSASIGNRTGGTVTLSGSITDSNDAGGGIALTNNTGATINFTGGMTLNTGASNAFSATGGGTVNVTGTNHLTANGGTALNISNTTIGASNVTFQDISANGGTNGIVLNSTGNSGHLAVTGTGSVAQGGNSSGGTIQNTTGAGISLTSTLSPTLNNMNIQSTGGSGISGTDVTNFSFTNGTINNSGTGHGVDASNIAFNSSPADATNNVDGTITITNNVLSNAFYHGVDIQNRAGTIDNATISNNAITSATAQANAQGSGIHIVTFGTATSAANLTKATIDGNTIVNFPLGAGIAVLGGNSNAAGPGGTMGVPNNASNVIAITNNNIHGQSTANPIGSEGIVAAVQGGNGGSRSQGNFNISGNSIANTLGQGIVLSDFGNATVNAKVNNNTVDTNNIGKNIGSNGIGIGTGVVGTSTSATPLMTVEVIGNTVTDYDGNGIRLVALDTNGTLNATVQNNSVGRAAGGGFPSRIRVDSGNENSAGNNTINLDISGNTGFGTSVAGDAPGIGLRLGDGGAATNVLRIEGFAGGSDVAVENYVAGKNPGMFAGTLGGAYSPAKIAEVIHGTTFGGTGSVPQPLLAVAGGVQAASPTPGETHLTQAQLDSVVAAAIAQWAHAGASASQLAALAAITFSVADLAGNAVAQQTPGHIVVDADAAGHGWFVDPTPSDNSEFTHAANAAGTKLLTDPTSAAAGHLDLLTTVTHEMGHELGLPDLTAASDANDLMYIDLVDGERRLPDAGDVPVTTTPLTPNVASGPVVPTATPGNDTIDAGHGGKILVGGAGADHFVFAQLPDAATPPTHVADYSFLQGDSFDFSALTSAFHGLAVDDAFVVRAVEDASGTFATLQVNTTPFAKNASWADVAQLDGAHAGDNVGVLIDGHAVHLAQVHVGLLP